MKVQAIFLPVAAFAMLSACGSKDDGKEGTSISVNGKGTNGDVAITADGKTGKVSVNVPGFNADMKLPKVMLDNSNFDLDGVKLYPNSKVRSVNVNGDESGVWADRSNVRVAFDSPADVGKVKSWFEAGFKQHEIAVSATPTGFTGKTDDGQNFIVTLKPDGQAATSGTIDIAGKPAR